MIKIETFRQDDGNIILGTYEDDVARISRDDLLSVLQVVLCAIAHSPIDREETMDSAAKIARSWLP